MNDEKLIKKYSYYYNINEGFVEEYLQQFKEVEKLLNLINIRLEVFKDEYEISINDGVAIMIINKKTKDSYKLTIEF